MSLVLTRKQDQSITIELESGDKIVITLKKIVSLKSAKIAIDAPRHLPVARSEILPRDTEAPQGQ